MRERYANSCCTFSKLTLHRKSSSQGEHWLPGFSNEPFSWQSSNFEVQLRTRVTVTSSHGSTPLVKDASRVRVLACLINRAFTFLRQFPTTVEIESEAGHVNNPSSSVLQAGIRHARNFVARLWASVGRFWHKYIILSLSDGHTEYVYTVWLNNVFWYFFSCSLKVAIICSTREFSTSADLKRLTDTW